MKWLLGLIGGNPLIGVWLIVGAFALGGATGGAVAWKVQGWRLDSVTAKFDGFVATTKTIGEASQAAAVEKTRLDIAAKRRADDENKGSLDSLRADNKRLRDARSGSGFVPAASATTSRHDLACFDRSELESALQRFDSEVTGIVDEGGETTVNLNTAKLWAQSTTTSK